MADDNHEVDEATINAALDIVAFKEELMTDEEIRLKDMINKELAARKNRARVAMIKAFEDGTFAFDWVQPIDPYFDEFPEVDEYVTTRLAELFKTGTTDRFPGEL